MTPPPKYPRVLHLDGTSAAASDDRIASEPEYAALLSAEVVVEEKLDGMNVMLWAAGGSPQVGTRGGADTSDRSGERGRIRAWAGARTDAVVSVLADELVVYGEWLRRRHLVPYDRLPAEFVVLDVYSLEADAFLTPAGRDDVADRLGMVVPPRRYHGVLRTMAHVHELLGDSAYGPSRAEGIVVRTVDGSPPRVAKYVDPAWRGIGSAPWSGHNSLAAVAPAPT